MAWLGIHFGVKAWRKRKRNEFDEGVAAKEGIEDRRREWSNWTEELEKQGIDRYELPFYLLVGEPQSGKSVLLHNSDLHFPFGQNRLSGVGGTRGCDWWFTDEAVILDLAGRLFTHEGGVTDRLEFEAFLKLLYEFRPLCPANGVILVIPCDSLLQDDEDQCGLKASKIQNALLTVTTQLQAQLPVYLVLTKGDQIFGFAESVHRLDVERRHQMFGWSRPAEKIDSPFDVAEVKQGFEEMVRRSRLLRAHMAAGARLPEALPEVDRMFAFPHELAGLEANLEIYLKRIFTASNITDRVFFRGLYLTSGLQTGVPIAKVCTELFGKAGEADMRDLEALFNRQRAYFIKDLVRNRVFGERGLVRPTQGRVQQTRRSSLIGYGLSGALVVGSVIFAGVYLAKGMGEERQKRYEDAIESAETSLLEDRTLPDLLTTLQRASDAAKEAPDDLEKMHFDPSDEFERLYCKVFDERLLPEVKRLAIRDIDNRLDRGLTNYDELVLVMDALMPLLGETVDFADGAIQDRVTGLLENYNYRSKITTHAEEEPLSLVGAFSVRENSGNKDGMVREQADEERPKLLACAKRALLAVEDCIRPGASTRPRGALGYVLGWYGAESARETLLANDVLISNKALRACYALRDSHRVHGGAGGGDPHRGHRAAAQVQHDPAAAQDARRGVSTAPVQVRRRERLLGDHRPELVRLERPAGLGAPEVRAVPERGHGNPLAARDQLRRLGRGAHAVRCDRRPARPAPGGDHARGRHQSDGGDRRSEGAAHGLQAGPAGVARRGGLRRARACGPGRRDRTPGGRAGRHAALQRLQGPDARGRADVRGPLREARRMRWLSWRPTRRG